MALFNATTTSIVKVKTVPVDEDYQTWLYYITRYFNRDPYWDYVVSETHKSMLVLKIVVAFGGMICNVVNVVTFLRMGLEDSVSIGFFNLAISDVLFCSFEFMLKAFETQNWYPPYGSTVITSTLQWFFNIPRHAFQTTTMIWTTFMAIQRCLCVYLPFQFKGIFTRLRTFFIALVIWGYPLIWAGLRFSFRTLTFEPRFNKTYVFFRVKEGKLTIITSFSHFENFIFRTICIVVVLVCVIIMSVALKRSVRFRQRTSDAFSVTTTKTKSDTRSKSDGDLSKDKNVNSKERQAIVQVTLVSVLFILASLKALYDRTLAVLKQVIPYFTLKYLSLGAGYFAMLMVTYSLEFLVTLNSCANLFIYLKYNTKFRQVCLINLKLFRPRKKETSPQRAMEEI